MSNFLGESELKADTEDTRNQFHDKNSEKYKKMGAKGLNMAKKSNNFKEMEKASKRLQAKIQKNRKDKMLAKANRREEAKQMEFEVTSKEQIRKEARKNEKYEKTIAS